MYVCMNVCMNECMYECTYVRTYARTYVRTYACLDVQNNRNINMLTSAGLSVTMGARLMLRLLHYAVCIDAMLPWKIPVRGSVVGSAKRVLSSHGGLIYEATTMQSQRGIYWPYQRGAVKMLGNGNGRGGDGKHQQRLQRLQAPLQQQISWGKQIKDMDADSILALVAEQGPRFSGRNLATAAHRVAKRDKSRRLREDPRIAGLAELCTTRIAEFNSQALVNTAWAFAKAGVAAPQLFEAIASEASRRLKDFNSQDFVNTAWAFTTAGVAVPKLFE